MPVYEEIEDFEPISPKKGDISPRNTSLNARQKHLSELTSIRDLEIDRKQ